jgi:hypothetical protein
MRSSALTVATRRPFWSKMSACRHMDRSFGVRQLEAHIGERAGK